MGVIIGQMRKREVREGQVTVKGGLIINIAVDVKMGKSVCRRGLQLG